MKHYIGERVWIWEGGAAPPYRGIITEIHRFSCDIWTGMPRDENHSVFSLYINTEELFNTMIRSAENLKKHAQVFIEDIRS